MNIQELLPFLIPLVIVELVLLVLTLRHIFSHSKYKHGTRLFWVIVVIVGMQFIGPILYFIFGKEES